MIEMITLGAVFFLFSLIKARKDHERAEAALLEEKREAFEKRCREALR